VLVEIHIIQNHAPSNLNRDETGSPKECVFGAVKRARISSQCLKHSVRRSDVFRRETEGALGFRTRRLPELVREKMIAAGVSQDIAEIAARKTTGFGTGDGKEQEKLETRQTVFLTQADVSAIVDVLIDIADDAGTAQKFEKIEAKKIQADARLKGFRPITVDVALFGRMTTSEALRDVEAAVQVAHAISTHKVEHEFDYFTAVDDLRDTHGKGDDSGADMIGDVEFNSACYYKYYSVDVNAIAENLTGRKSLRRNIGEDETAGAAALAVDAVVAFAKAVLLTTPSGKQNSFAAHQLPATALFEIRENPIPISYANAFVEPVRPEAGRSLIAGSLDKLARHVEAITRGFNLEAKSRLLLAPEYPDFRIEGVERASDLNSLCSALKEVISGV
jgi:CRISPR system Cascade subunit CasC